MIYNPFPSPIEYEHRDRLILNINDKDYNVTVYFSIRDHKSRESSIIMRDIDIAQEVDSSIERALRKKAFEWIKEEYIGNE